MSRPADEASHRLFDSDAPRSEPRSEKEDTLRRGRALVRSLLAGAAFIGGVEALAYYYHVLQLWQSLVMTPSVPILVTLALFVDYEVMEMKERVRVRRVEGDLSKSSLIVVGGLATMVGLAFMMTGASTSLVRVTADVAAGTSIICAGIYIIKRFSW